MKRCIKCLMPDTRPRLTFTENGLCAACEWKNEKDTNIDWKLRQTELSELCNSIRGKNRYDCIVPVSGGKDSTYVAHKMKHNYNLSVLTVTIKPPLETTLIQDNLASFLSHGYDNIKITPNPSISQKINKIGFIEQGRPLLSWTTCLNTVMFQFSNMLNVPLVMFGEEGESEYGGSNKLRSSAFYSTQDAIDLYTYSTDPDRYSKLFPNDNLNMWTYPSPEELSKNHVDVGHWSYFENWDPYRHYTFARDNYNMKTNDTRNLGTYTNYGQLDTPLYELHTYMMYLKFGFGRCLQDACIDIRAGRISREEGLEYVKKYDGEYPTPHIEKYLEYYEMTMDEFNQVLDSYANKDLFEKKNGLWTPKFEIV